jgi:putative heme iron utilization protein
MSREVMRSQGRAALGTLMDGAPYVSLAMVAFDDDDDGAPLLLLSGLAQHSRNIAMDPRISLLFDGTAGLEEPLTGPRLTVLGTAALHDDPAARTRYVARHPSAAMYAGFSDFHLYRVTIDRAHFVSGFGKIRWVDAAELRLHQGTVRPR